MLLLAKFVLNLMRFFTVREARDGEAPRRGGAGRGGPPQRGRGGRGGGIGSNRDFGQNDANGFPSNVGGGGGEDLDSSRPSERGRGGYRPSYRGGRRGGYGNREAEGDSEQPPRRMYERRSGTGRGYEVKRDGAGRGNWGTTNDDMIAQLRTFPFTAWFCIAIYRISTPHCCR